LFQQKNNTVKDEEKPELMKNEHKENEVLPVETKVEKGTNKKKRNKVTKKTEKGRKQDEGKKRKRIQVLSDSEEEDSDKGKDISRGSDGSGLSGQVAKDVEYNSDLSTDL
jgi:hypothetical protein